MSDVTHLYAVDHRALTAFVVDNPDLERLEVLLDRFNIFEAMGIVEQERRHSDFLAFLLDPRQSHHLGGTFARRLLQRTLLMVDASRTPVSAIDLDGWPLAGLTVQREWRNIDLLLTDAAHRLAVIVENKVRSQEHSDQLRRYRATVEAQFPGWKVLGLYLTPAGEPPSDDMYVPVDYGVVADTVEAVAESRGPSLEPAVHALMTHYSAMLRRHLVEDSEIARLCQQIYRNHQRALDLILEHRPDDQAVMRDFLVNLISARGDLVLQNVSKRRVHFTIPDWDRWLAPTGDQWRPDGQLLYFQFRNEPTKVNIELVVGPGPQELRDLLISAARTTGSPLKATSRSTTTWMIIFNLNVLAARDFETAGLDDLKDRVGKRWLEFLDHGLPVIREKLDPIVEQLGNMPSNSQNL